MATPIVAAEVALVRARYPDLRNDKVARHIARNALRISGIDQARIDVGAAVTTAPEAEVSPTPASPITPIDNPPFFVQQQYFDFLNRQPDSAGLSYWSDQIAGNVSNAPAPCPAGDVNCVLQRRINVSAAFFIESEFQDTGGFINRLYKSSLGRQSAYTEFMVDRLRVVGGPTLDASKQIFADAWVQRPDFLQKYPTSLDGPGFIDALLQTVLQNSGVNLSSQRQSLIDDYNANHSRARITRLVADNPTFAQSEYNASFVLTQYFGYLRRDPDPNGFAFWLNILNNREPNNYRGMVCSFITSDEFQRRFGALVTHHNSECGR